MMLRKIKQEFAHDPDGEGTYGDCFRTCIAMMTGMERDQVPHFMHPEEPDFYGWQGCRRWLERFSLTLSMYAYQGDLDWEGILSVTANQNAMCPTMICGARETGTQHVVVALDGTLWCDPLWGDEEGSPGLDRASDEDGVWWLVNIVYLPAYGGLKIAETIQA